MRVCVCVCVCDKRDNAYSSLIRPSCVINYTVRLFFFFFTPRAEDDVVHGRKNKYRRRSGGKIEGEKEKKKERKTERGQEKRSA